MRSEQENFAAHVVTQITTAPATLDNGKRSPQRVQKLLTMLESERLSDAISLMHEKDTRIFRAIRSIRDWHTRGQDKEGRNIVTWGEAERTWQMVKEKLRGFAFNHSGQELLDPIATAQFLREVRENLQSAAARMAS